MVQCESRYAQGDQQDNTVLVQRISLPEDGQVKEHDRKEFAGLREDKRQVVDMRQTSVAKWRCQ